MKSVLQGMRNTANYIAENQDVEGGTVTVRPSATAILAIDSDDRYLNYLQRRQNPTYPFQFNIQKNESLLNGFFKRLAMTEFRLNWTLPNLSVAWGNTTLQFHYSTTGADLVLQIIIPDGFYSADELRQELQSQIRTVIPAFLVTISDKDDNTLNFNAPAGTFFFFESMGSTNRELVDMLNVPTQPFLFLKTITGAVRVGASVTYTVPSGTAHFLLGQQVAVSGITGGTGWNIAYNNYLAPATVIAKPSATTVTLLYPIAPTGTPSSYAGSQIINLYYPVITSGIPNLRPMDYFDIVCSQLSYNQELKDATSAPITRDMIARIYLDDGTPSQAIFNTNIYGNTVVSTIISGATRNVDEVIFTVTASATFTVGSQATIQGITGGVGWNSVAEIVEILSGTSITVIYAVAPSGTPSSYSGATIRSFAQTGFSTPQTTWDDRVNGVTPFVLYRQFNTPKYIRWNNKMPIGNLTFEMYDDQGRNIESLWDSAYPATTFQGFAYANSFTWNATLLVSED